ncbi:MAG: single-stranded-DNA-specific exonuclease RecJ [Acidobacteria bacterium]|nr:single-stranded-DNA-specific exonuclease RecJ [Acidobacteriota bacterium]
MRWQPRSLEPEPSSISSLAREANLDPLLARLLIVRGVCSAEDARRFLNPSLNHLHAPEAMLGMQAAVERLSAAIERRETALIYGDYDVDGTVAVVILKTAIELCGGVTDFHVPHRIRDGYGMKGEVIEAAAAAGVRLVISVDTGIRAFAAAEAAQRAGVDLIVTDHHLPEATEGVPRALAVLNPNQAGCGYPSKSLCGAGVAFKLAQALLEKYGRERVLPSFLKILALATIADAVALSGENRVFASLGLEGLRSPVNSGLKALLEVASLNGSRPLTATDVAFRLAPRINAAGRMDVAQDVIELLTVRDADRAAQIAARLDELNAERQQEERRIGEEIEKQIAENPALREAWCMVLDGEGWHRGVIGIAATRVVERYSRPALVISRESGDHAEAHGSGRSIPAFHLLDALESAKHLFTRYGGHAHAVGFALPASRLPELRAAMDAGARRQLTPADLEPTLAIDAELPIESVGKELLRTVQRLAPFGKGNPQPVFVSRGVRLLQPPQIIKEQHVKLRIAEPGPAGGSVKRALDAMGWRMAEPAGALGLAPGEAIDVAYTLEENSNPDFGGLQLNLADVKRAS